MNALAAAVVASFQTERRRIVTQLSIAYSELRKLKRQSWWQRFRHRREIRCLERKITRLHTELRQYSRARGWFGFE